MREPLWIKSTSIIFSRLSLSTWGRNKTIKVCNKTAINIIDNSVISTYFLENMLKKSHVETLGTTQSDVKRHFIFKGQHLTNIHLGLCEQ